ncbi:hypothetical protein [Rhizobium leguminosarum]|uniref:hypothetical protein n=1 Tax=Rhizobium leguminosarum TaxID=384 RepID=UPI0014427B10|nr:hypothetical protein [Rhizobium leguminosarum]
MSRSSTFGWATVSTGPSIARSSFAFGLGVVYLPANANLVEEPDGQSVITKPGR